MILTFIKTYLVYIQLAALGLVIVGGLWWHRHAMTVQFEKGQAAGQERLFKEQADALEVKAAEERATIAADRAEVADMLVVLDAKTEALQSEKTALAAQRRSITATLNQGLGALAGQEAGLRNEIQNVSDADAIARLRVALERARIADRERPASVIQ